MARRPFHGLIALILVAAGSPLFAETEPRASSPAVGPGASVWTPLTRQRMVREAIKVAPPALVRILRRHPEALMDGVHRGAEFEGQPHHRQENEIPGAGAAAALATVGSKAVDALNRHRPMRELVYYMGLAAHFASDLSDPILTAPGGGTAGFTSDYARFIEESLGRFPVVFYGYPDATGPPAPQPPPVDLLEPEGHGAARAARGYFPHLARAYRKSRGTSETFDVRSIPFGVASLCYSRGVTNIARAWLQIWQSARGDITGTPHLEAPGNSPGAPARSSGSTGSGSATELHDASQD